MMLYHFKKYKSFNCLNLYHYWSKTKTLGKALSALTLLNLFFLIQRESEKNHCDGISPQVKYA